MELKDRLREWRIRNDLTQEKAAEKLNVAPQTVSKWERGILAPDVTLIPRIAMLYHTSADELLGMNELLEENAEEKFNLRLNQLHREGKWMECAELLEQEIGHQPDKFELYSTLTGLVRQKKIYDASGIRRLMRLAERVELFCRNNDIRAAVCKNMMLICKDSGDETIRKSAVVYRDQLPSVYASRELYGVYCLEGAPKENQLKANAYVLADFLEITIRSMITDDKTDEEKMELYIRAAQCYELIQMDPVRYTVGSLEVQMLYNLGHAAQLAFQLGLTERARDLLEKIRINLEGWHGNNRKQSPLIFNAHPRGEEFSRKQLSEVEKWLDQIPVFREYLKQTENMGGNDESE
ncbi:MAG: helix-turn-helix transcriptional regulator [Clostridia bacterium]|nr:helix-turn-helix transcriptional regulator [Clostridia bacterium]